MNLHMTPMQSRLLAVLLLIILTALLVAVVAVPTWQLHERYNANIADNAEKIQRYRRLGAMKPEVDQAIQEVTERNASQYYLKGASKTLAEAELQSLVTRLVESKSCRIISSQILPVKDDPKTAEPGKVQMSVQLHAAIVPLQVLLHALETNKPYLFIENLSIRGAQGRAYKPAPGIQPEYQVNITLTAYMPPSEDGK